MKVVIALVLTVISFNTFANWTGTKCSNSDGTVNWETGYKEDLINLKYSNFIEGTLTLEVENVNIEFVRNITLTEKRSRTCSALNKGRVYAGLVKITGSEKSPDILKGQFPQNRVQTQVICTTVESEPLPCNDIE